ncbi:DUF2971 domain-containing protein [Candidatus Nitrotoga arctica]|uniref:DUF2971 domain-containing protein n=1 Tax=Candidatus Nitrotoga arctica TaxID=453162 RepID=A0ABN8AR84_9PROT|nr:DUF2971 domain-containing protein [Candidatus Nitrotoga arctica]CAG9932947.1 protein of unknown function [Candidatus Nitrotoga arctica]
MTPPTLLYKYEPFTAQSLQNLKNQVIYFGSPLNFNDPYDCALTPNFKKPTNDEINKIRDHYLADPDLEDNIRQMYKTALPSKLEEIFIRTCENVLKDAIQKFLLNRGVSCFSEKKDNLLMWSHYGDHCKGFCLEFKSSADPFQGLKKVLYKQDIPVFDIVHMLCDEDFDPIIVTLYCTKAIDWAYEQEWRVIHSQAGTALWLSGRSTDRGLFRAGHAICNM